MNTRIFVKENESGYTRYYYANWRLTDQGMDVIYAGGPTYERIVKDHGEKGATLYMKVYNMTTSFGFTLMRGYLKVSRNPAVKWEEIEPQILDAIREVHGNFKIERESVAVRFTRNIRRLTTKK